MGTDGHSGLSVRVADLARASDLESLAALRYQWRAEERGETGMERGEFVDALVGWLRAHESSHVGFLGELDGSAVAIAWLALVERVPGPGAFRRTCGYVQSVYVAPSQRSRGLGAMVMTQLIEHARNSGLDYLAVHPSPASFAFYRRLGFANSDGVLELDFRPSRTSA
jgi:GNAT superfamily N-acetyltransferase